VNGIVDEALDEAVGRSSKRWALVLLAFVVGGAVAVWLSRRSPQSSTDVALPTAGSAAENAPSLD
jgi:hypothetical protein